MAEKQAVTIHDIAREARVSPSTVSRVLNGTTPVAPEKRKAVLDAVETLKYRPNVVAQGLARGKSRAVGVISQDISNDFFGQILSGIEEGLRGTGYYPIFTSGSGRERANEALALLTDHRVDSLIVVGGGMSDSDLVEVASRVPLVAVGRSVPGIEDRCLRVENFEGALQATRYLIGLGHERIAHLTGIPGHRHAIDRHEGYLRALSDAGIEVDPRLIAEGDFTEPSGFRAAQRLLDSKIPFTAIFAGNDHMAYGAQLALYDRGLRVPEDVSMVGFDDHRHAPYMLPPLTTVRQTNLEMGIAAVRALLDLLKGQPFALRSFPTELVVRRSAAAPRKAKAPR